ncbi:MAG: superoxide dismutase, partial [Verrucomicrobiota bacterium]|nr:superoxide dismutase [Verrucomicrobiota bacterium]
MAKNYYRRDILKISLLAGVAAGLKVYSLDAQTPAAKRDISPDIYLQKYPFILPPLGYDFNALEPFIDARTMQIHYEKHHGAYVKNLNEAIASDPVLQKLTLGALLADLDQVPEPIRAKCRNNGGGHLNHSLFWPSMKKGIKWNDQSAFAQKAVESFGSKEAFL